MQSLTMENMRREAVKAAVMRQISCPVKFKILDIDSAYLITNRDSKAMCIVSGEAWDDIRSKLPVNWASVLEVWEGKTGDELK